MLGAHFPRDYGVIFAIRFVVSNVVGLILL